MSNKMLQRGARPAIKAALLTSSLLAGGWACTAAAQLNVPPPTQIAVEENGVNTATGLMKIPSQTVSIGPPEDPLVYEDYSGSGSPFHNFHLDMFTYTLPTGNDIRASVMNDGYARSKSFFRPYSASPGFVIDDGLGASLTQSGSVYTVTVTDGTKYVYGNADMQTSDATGGQGWTGRVTEIVRPDGTKLNLSYKNVTYTCPNSYCNSTGGSQETKVRIQSVVRSDGYQLHFNYLTNLTSTGAQQYDWDKISSVVAFNQAGDYCSPIVDTCTFTKQWPTLSYQRNMTNGDVTVTTPKGAAIYSSGFTTTPFFKYQSPGAFAPNLVVNYGTDWRVANVSRDGVTWNYTWTQTPVGWFPVTYMMTMVRSNPDGTSRTVVTSPDSASPSSITDEAGNTWSYTYSGALLTKAEAPNGRYTSYAHDSRGNNTTVTNVAKPGSGLPNIVSSASYPSTCSNRITCNRPTWTKDALGNQTDYTYDPVHGGVLTVTNPADVSGVRPQARYSYTPVQAYLKNAAGSIVASGPLVYKNTGFSVCSSATSANPASCVGSAAESKATFSFGPQAAGTANNLLQVSQTASSGDNSISTTSSSTYDLLGNKTSIDGPLTGSSDTTVFRYDAASRLVGVVSPDPDGAGARLHFAQRNTYNARGHVAQTEIGTVNDQTDAAWAGFSSQQQMAISYDANARPVKAQRTAAGTTYAVTQQNYDLAGRVKCNVMRMDPAQWSGQADACVPQLSGPNGPDRVAQTTYDQLSRIDTISKAVGTADATVARKDIYTPNGELASSKDGENNLTTYEYDGFGRLSKARYPVATKGAQASSTSDYEETGYNANGSIVSRRLRDGQSINYGYDNLNRLLSKDLPGSEPDATYSYDLRGRMTTANQNGASLGFGYDALGRNVSQSGWPAALGATYDAAGRRTTLTYPGTGLTVGYSYDTIGAMTEIRENPSGSNALLASFAYDSLGRRTSLTRGNGTVTSYSHDSISRLTALTQDLAGSAQDLTVGLSYNPASQISAITRSNDSYAWGGHYNVDRNYTANGLNQYSAAGSISIGYDNRGNLTSSGANNYTYSSENRLLTAPGGASVAYDPLGRLYFAGISAPWTYLGYDGQRQIAEYDSWGGVLRRYVHGQGIDEPIVWYEGAGTSDKRWLHADERGSIIAISNGSGTTTNLNAYDEYGIPASTNVGRFGYTGQAWIPQIGMWNYKARIYSPTLGRFMQTDPIGYQAGMNLYNYVRSDPVNSADPFGLEEGGGQQTIFQSVIIVTGIRDIVVNGGTISISGISGMDISVNNSFAPVFGGINVGQGIALLTALKQVALADANEEIVVTAGVSKSDLADMRISAEGWAKMIEWYMGISIGLMAPELKAGGAMAEKVASTVITNARIRGALTAVGTIAASEIAHDELVNSLLDTMIDMQINPHLYPLEMQHKLGGGMIYHPN